MSVALQIRGVPEDVRDVLADEAARQGQSMQALLLSLVTREARAQANAQMFDRLAPYRVDLSGFDTVAMIREGRDNGFEVDRNEYDRR